MTSEELYFHPRYTAQMFFDLRMTRLHIKSGYVIVIEGF